MTFFLMFPFRGAPLLEVVAVGILGPADDLRGPWPWFERSLSRVCWKGKGGG